MFSKNFVYLLVQLILLVVVYFSEIHHAVEILDYQTYPKYEFKYGVEDHHTGDLKERAELRDGDLVKQEYSWGEKDRIVKVSKIDDHDVPVQIAHHLTPHHHY